MLAGDPADPTDDAVPGLAARADATVAIDTRTGAVADQPYSYSAYIRRPHAAEKAAGVDVIEYRGAHSFRRHVPNNAPEATGGNLAQAAQYIGGRGLATVARSYARVRDG